METSNFAFWKNSRAAPCKFGWKSIGIIMILICSTIGQWLKYETGYEDPFPYIYCQSTTAPCSYYPPTPHRKQGHSAIVFKTYSTDDMNNLCPGDL